RVDRQVAGNDILSGRVFRVHGLTSIIRTVQGDFECSTRGLLKSLATDLQHVLVAGDFVTIRSESETQGVVLRVEPRRNVIRRESKGKQQIIAANLDLVFIVTSAAEPTFKPNLVDRILVTAEAAGIEPVIVINKIDLADGAALQPILGVWGQLGYSVLQVSATNAEGLETMVELMRHRDSVLVGQSGVGKSSILNAIDPNLRRRVASVSVENQKGRHTTTVAELMPLPFGGYVVDTPGVRQFQLFDVIPEEVINHFRDLRVFVDRCRYPSCTHLHEQGCGIRDALADGYIAGRRYDSYCQLRSDRGE
ncbi:MAG TPA: ribosome small subunit-dependent GTPase A, partial [Pirellulaceae bacterium]|nr:ribosome small subunit-dependent GTPase A [Pirellulaceae bacterium]